MDYYTNTEAFAKNCENKDKPQLHCDGKCQMMKALNKEDKKDQENPERKAENKNEITLSSRSFFADVPIYIAQLTSIEKISSHSNGEIIDRCFDIFHPPQV